jgi:hypothetical protein
LLRPGDRPTALQRWYDRLAPLVAEAQTQLRSLDLGQLTRLSGCTRTEDGALCLTALWEDYVVRTPGFDVQRADTGQAPTPFLQALLLTYLVMADGTPPSGHWVAYRDLPDGMFYAQAFRGYAETRLARELGEGGLTAFREAARRLGGKRIAIGDAGYAFRLLPRVHLAAVYWLGDEDFPSQASILFEDSAPHYLSTDGLAVLGSHLTNALLKEASAG